MANSYAVVKMHVAAVAEGDGTPAQCCSPEGGAFATLTVQVQGITTAIIYWEGTIDGTNWKAISGMNVGTGAEDSACNADAVVRLDVRGFVKVRARIGAYTAGSINVTGVLTEV